MIEYIGWLGGELIETDDGGPQEVTAGTNVAEGARRRVLKGAPSQPEDKDTHSAVTGGDSAPKEVRGTVRQGKSAQKKVKRPRKP